MKIHRYTGIFLLGSFSQGLLVPVLSFILMDRGMTLQNLGLAIGIYSLTAAVLELPTGITADMLGRKKTYILSLLISACSFVVLLAGYGCFWALLSSLLMGAGRAFSSGSLEALFIDRCKQTYGQGFLPKAMKYLSITDSAGLAAGALLGGLLPLLTKRLFPAAGLYDLSLLLRTALCLALAGMVIFLIPLDRPLSRGKSVSLRNHLSQGVNLVRNSPVLKRLFISVIGTGFVLCVLETYWQPRFSGLLGGGQNHSVMLGLLSLLYMGTVSAGNLLSEKLLSHGKIGYKTVFLSAKVGMLFFVVLASLACNAVLFAVFYCLLYFFFGAANIPEGAMINREIPDETRASILSAQSLITQVGVLSASVSGSALMNFLPLKAVWLFAAAVAMGFLIPSFSRKLQAAKPAHNEPGIPLEQPVQSTTV